MSNTNDPTGWMWVQACDLMEQAERLHRQFFRLTASQQTLAMWEPPVDVFEDEREIVVVVAMPGVSAEQVQVSHEPGTLVVRGARPLSIGGSRRIVRHLEIPYGTFERRIRLPSGPLEVGTPELVQGCLILRMRKLGQGR